MIDKQSQRRIAYIFWAFITGIISIYLIERNWYIAIAGGLILTLISSFAINAIANVVLNKIVLSTYQDTLEGLREQLVVAVPCAFCSKTNAVPFRLNVRNEFKCEHCQKPNLLVIDASTAQITEPIAGIISSDASKISQ